MILSSQHLDAATLQQFVAAIKEFQPEVLWVYPSALESLCSLLVDAGEVLRIACVLSSSEMLAPGTWELASRVLNCRIVDYYGQAERVAFAISTAPGQYRFLPGYAWVELLPSENDSRRNVYEVIGTSLWNDSMPLLRYRTGDMIELDGEPSAEQLEEITFGMREFGGIIGRASEYLAAPGGARIVGLNHLPRGVQNLVRLQLIQQTNQDVTILVLATQSFCDADLAQLKTNLRQKLPSSMRFTIKRVSTLTKIESGKSPFVIRMPQVKELASRDAPQQSPM